MGSIWSVDYRALVRYRPQREAAGIHTEPIEERRSGKLFPKAIRDVFIKVDNFSFFQVILHSGI
jgi:hypothetical protein